MAFVSRWSRFLELACRSGAVVEAGLTASELSRAEAHCRVRFPPDLAQLLGEGLPTGPAFPDWRRLPDNLDAWLRQPLDGVLFDVEMNDFWHPGWGRRPLEAEAARAVAEVAVKAAPPLVPVYLHRFLAAEPLEAGNPVFSIMQTDVVCYGRDLASYAEAEWETGWEERWIAGARPVRFWSQLAG
jgi:hypothetical protein